MKAIARQIFRVAAIFTTLAVFVLWFISQNQAIEAKHVSFDSNRVDSARSRTTYICLSNGTIAIESNQILWLDSRDATEITTGWTFSSRPSASDVLSLPMPSEGLDLTLFGYGLETGPIHRAIFNQRRVLITLPLGAFCIVLIFLWANFFDRQLAKHRGTQTTIRHRVARMSIVVLTTIGVLVACLTIRSLFFADTFNMLADFKAPRRSAVADIHSLSIMAESASGGLYLMSGLNTFRHTQDSPYYFAGHDAFQLQKFTYPHTVDLRGEWNEKSIDWKAVGFQFYWYTRNEPQRTHRWLGIVIPLPVLAIIALFIPVRTLTNALRRRHRDQRIKMGQCVSCGYDLRASKDRCPECGSPISSV